MEFTGYRNLRKPLLIVSVFVGLLLALAGTVLLTGDLDRLLLSTAAQLQRWSGVVPTAADATATTAASYEDRLRQRLGLDWTILAGRWRVEDGVVTYLGPDDRAGHGLILSRQGLWNGSLETVVRIAGGPDTQAQIAFSHNPVTRAFYAAGIGDTHAYALQAFTDAAQLVQVFGQRQDIGSDASYRLTLRLTGEQYSLSVNDVKVMSGVLPTPPFSDRVGLYATGDGPVSFRAFQVEAREPP